MTWEAQLRDITADQLAELQAKYPDAKVTLEAHPKHLGPVMDEASFWGIIDLLDWSTADRQAILMPAVEALSALSRIEVCQFHDLLHEKLYALDGQRFAEHLGSNAWPPKEGRHFSVDDFLYSRCAVVANGREFYEEVLAEPSRIPKEFTFEPLLYLPDRAWALKTGQPLDHFPPLSCETFSNAEGWPGIRPLAERLKR